MINKKFVFLGEKKTVKPIEVLRTAVGIGSTPLVFYPPMTYKIRQKICFVLESRLLVLEVSIITS